MTRDNDMTGEAYQYPITINKVEGIGYKEIIINNRDELLNYVFEILEENVGLKKTLIDMLKENGIVDTVNLIDERTAQLMRLYEFYKTNPSQLNYGIFFNTVTILNPIYRVNHGGF